MKRTEIEICIEQPATAVIAHQLGADRVELCSALDLGGLTPSYGLIEACTGFQGLEVFVMIRPRPGNFVYNAREIEVMIRDIHAAKEAGAHGVVFGCLMEDNNLDIDNTRRLYETAVSYGLGTTFHRAFDFVVNPRHSLEKLMDIGLDRILTSGTKPKAFEGLNLIQNMVELSGDKIDIMAGSGINHENARQIMETGVHALHFTARKTENKVDKLNMGLRYQPDPEKIKKILHVIAKT